nr:hypothetical protein [Planctomycetota bacterium]
ASALLHHRIAELLMDVGTSETAYIQELLPEVDALVPDRRARLLDHWLRAVRLRENLPTRGFTHLSRLSIHAPEIAADAAREGDEALFQRAMSAGAELMRLRRARLEQIFVPLLVEAEGPPPLVHRAALLAAGLGAVARIRTALEAGRPEDAQRVVEAYAEVAGQNRVLDALRRLAAGR